MPASASLRSRSWRAPEPFSRFTTLTFLRARSSTERIDLGFPGDTTSPICQKASVTTVVRRRPRCFRRNGRLNSPDASRRWTPARWTVLLPSSTRASVLPMDQTTTEAGPGGRLRSGSWSQRSRRMSAASAKSCAYSADLRSRKDLGETIARLPELGEAYPNREAQELVRPQEGGHL
jgi:hypothetical protein